MTAGSQQKFICRSFVSATPSVRVRTCVRACVRTDTHVLSGGDTSDNFTRLRLRLFTVSVKFLDGRGRAVLDGPGWVAPGSPG